MTYCTVTLLNPKMNARMIVEGAEIPCLTRFQLNFSMATVAPTFSLRTRSSASSTKHVVCQLPEMR